MLSEEFKNRLISGEVLFGTFVKINNPSIVEIIGQSDFDFIIIDREHSSFTHTDVERMIMAADVCGLPTIVRTPNNSEEYILHSLDSGACGIQVPNVTNIDQVKEAASSAKYYPEGNRGLSFAQRAAKYGYEGGTAYIEASNKNSVVVVHIENKMMAERVEEICKIPQVDVLFVGPADLSQSMGKPGQTNDPEVVALIQKVFKVGLENNKKIGIYVGNEDALKKYADMGATYFAWKSDVLFLADGINNSKQIFTNIKTLN